MDPAREWRPTLDYMVREMKRLTAGGGMTDTAAATLLLTTQLSMVDDRLDELMEPLTNTAGQLENITGILAEATREQRNGAALSI